LGNSSEKGKDDGIYLKKNTKQNKTRKTENKRHATSGGKRVVVSL